MSTIPLISDANNAQPTGAPAIVTPQLTTAEKVAKFMITAGILIAAIIIGTLLTGVLTPYLGSYGPAVGTGIAFTCAMTAIGKLEGYFNERAARRMHQDIAIIPQDVAA